MIWLLILSIFILTAYDTIIRGQKHWEALLNRKNPYRNDEKTRITTFYETIVNN